MDMSDSATGTGGLSGFERAAERVRSFPQTPGVYLMKDAAGLVIYIGKAKNLRNRVRSYFQQRKHQSAKNISMIKRITDVEWLVVRSEVEAL